MKILCKLALCNLKSNRRSLLTLLGITMSVGLITLVCAIGFLAAESVSGNTCDPESIKAVNILKNGFIAATSLMSCVMIYAAFSVSFDTRVNTIGLLASNGMSNAQKCVMILTEALIYGCCGSILGVLLGSVAARLFYGCGADIISELTGTDCEPFSVSPACVILSAALGLFSTLIASFVPMLKIRHISVMDSIYGRTKINISLKQGFFSRIVERCFGRLGKLAAQNHENHKSKYRAISFALSGGTIFFFAIYCFFMYPIRYDIERGQSPDTVLYALFFPALALAALFILIFLICACGSAAINIDLRKHELAMLKSIGMPNSKLCEMMCIESIFLVYYSVIYALGGSLLADWLICTFFRIVSEPFLKFHYPVTLFLCFVIFDTIIGLLFALYSSFRVKRINIIEAIKNNA